MDPGEAERAERDMPDATEPERPSTGALGQAQISVDLPASPDGAAWRAWQGHLSFASQADLLDPTAAPDFHAFVRIYTLGPYQFADSSGSHAIRCRRTRELIVRSAIDHVVFNLHREGTYAGTCAGRPYLTRPGDVGCYDFGQPYEFVVSSGSTLALIVPREQLPEGLKAYDLHGIVPPADLPATRLMATMLGELHAAMPTLTPAQGEAALRSIVALAEAVFANPRSRRRTIGPGDLDLYGRAQVYVEKAIGDPDLSVESLAKALKVSRSGLYDVFVGAGGVQAYVRERRLQRCYDLIVLGNRHEEPLVALAKRFGFRSEAHFSRLFKERFGLSPGRMRASAREGGVSVTPAKAGGVASESLTSLGKS